MTFSEIQSKIYFLTKTNSTSLPLATQTILVKNAMERVSSLIQTSDKRWQWDDSNYTSDFPIATTNLVSGQADYSVAVSHLKMLRVEMATSAALDTWTKLEPYDQQDESGSLTQYALVSGIPYRYDKLGVSIILDPKPNFSATAGLKVYYQRAQLDFDYTLGTFTNATGSTSSKPGFSSLYHDIVPLWASYDYALANSMANANQLMMEIQRKEKTLTDDYSSRDKDDHAIITMKKISFI